MARSSKTEQVMGLVSGKKKAEESNPLVGAKVTPAVAAPSKTAPVLNAIKPVKPVQNKPDTRYTWNGSGKQIVNIITMLINEELGAVMDRFNVCDCDKCCKFVTEVVAGAIPPVFVHVKSRSGEEAVNKALAKYRTAVIKALTKAVLIIKKSPPHE